MKGFLGFHRRLSQVAGLGFRIHGFAVEGFGFRALGGLGLGVLFCWVKGCSGGSLHRISQDLCRGFMISSVETLGFSIF